MTGRTPGWRLGLVAVLLVGLVGFAGPFSSGAIFTDSQDATGNATAAEKFSGGGSGGPTADAGGPYTVAEGDSTTLDGTGSQTNNNPTYSWVILSGPGALSNNQSKIPTYVAPTEVNQDTTVTVELTVTDNMGSDTATATITVRDTSSSSDTTAPKISNFDVSKTGDHEITVTFDSNETLSSIRAALIRKNDGTEVLLTENDFQTSQSGGSPTYTATTLVSKKPKHYSATLREATDSAGNDGASGETDSV
ncbi:PKD domain-containing protein [Halobacteriales archaeon Cl-PHB]